MTETKFTPGPWHACYPDKLFPHVHIGPNRCIDPYIWYDNGEPQKVTSLHALNINTTEDGASMSEHRANASLIAAAPDMYKALEVALHTLNELPAQTIIGCVAPQVFEQLMDALAKARGEQ